MGAFPLEGGSGCQGVAVWVVAFSFALLVVGPVGVEVAVGLQGAEFEDGFGGLDAPAGAGDVHAVFDQVAAGAFDDAGGDGPAVREGGGVVQPGGFGFQVAGGLVRGLAFGCGQGSGGGAQGGRDGGGVAVQDFGGAVADPGAGVGAGVGEQAPGGVPQGLDDGDEVADDRDGDAAGGGLGADPGDLVLVAVGQRDPGPFLCRVAAAGFGERGGHDVGGVGGHAGGQPLAGGCRAGPAGAGSQDVVRSAGHGGQVEDRGDLGHPLA